MRQTTLKGLPADTGWMKIFITNKKSKMERGRMIRVRDGEATFSAAANSFITLLVDGESPF
jgi:hypothetical protein